MASAPDPDDDTLFDDFLAQRGHEDATTWDRSYNKLQCPECAALHEDDAGECSVCGWMP